MDKKTKYEGISILIFTILYAAFNYIPLEHFIENEFVFLAIKFFFYLLLDIAIIFVKHKLEIEIERPYKSISVLWLFPLLLICFTHPLYALIFNPPTIENPHHLVIALDCIVDLVVAVIEDLLYVDFMIDFLTKTILKKLKYKFFIATMLAAVIFTLIHCYTFIYEGVDDSIVILITVFFLICECSYMAIYFNSAIIPVFAHAIFNILNFVICAEIFEYDSNSIYYVSFCLIIFFLSVCYLAAIYNLSRKHIEIEILKDKYGKQRSDSIQD